MMILKLPLTRSAGGKVIRNNNPKTINRLLNVYELFLKAKYNYIKRNRS